MTRTRRSRVTGQAFTHSEQLELNEFLYDRQINGDWQTVGMSSNAMLAAALEGHCSPERDPMDMADLNRCRRTYNGAPAFLQRRMKPILDQWMRDFNVDIVARVP
jgi:hypothetical protein